jgi:DNA phosphorothioation-associated putative methyltransferase
MKMTIILRHKTAMSRSKISRPCQWILENTEPSTILDYGCGKGFDSKALDEAGWRVVSYDPHYAPTKPGRHETFDWVLCAYVLNVIEDVEERKSVVQDLETYGRNALIVVRSISDLTGNLKPYEDGFLTQRGTFQKGYTVEELQAFLGSDYKIWRVKHSIFALLNP